MYTEIEGELKVGDYLDSGITADNERVISAGESNRATIVRIIDAEKTDLKALIAGLTSNQRAYLGENLLDDERLKGKIKPDKIYVLEI